MGRSIDDLADIDGKHRKAMGELKREMAKQAAPTPVTRADKVAPPNGPIPDAEGMPTGLTGVKAPAGYRQTDGIEDRLRAAGVKPFVMK